MANLFIKSENNDGFWDQDQFNTTMLREYVTFIGLISHTK